MKASRVKEMLKVAGVSITMIAVFAVALLGINTFTLRAATEGETYLPPETEYVNIPDNPVPYAAAHTAPSVTVIDTTILRSETALHGPDVVDAVSPLALSIDDAVAIVTQHIYEVFGESIDGMYVEIGYTEPEWLTRTLWSANVSSVNRHIVERRVIGDAWSLEVRARVEAGEDWDSVVANPPEILLQDYIVADFRVVIDAITGERIDAWHTNTAMQPVPMGSHDIIEAYVASEWDGCWESALNADFTPQMMAELYELAERIAPKQFVNSNVDSVEFSGAHRLLYVNANGNVVARSANAGFTVTDDNGRVAMIMICTDSMRVQSINSSRNDFDESTIQRPIIERSEDGTYRIGTEGDGFVPFSVDYGQGTVRVVYDPDGLTAIGRDVKHHIQPKY